MEWLEAKMAPSDFFQEILSSMKVSIETKKVTKISQMAHKNGSRRLNMIYFEEVGDKCLTRILSPHTNVEHLKLSIKRDKIYVPTNTIIAQEG